MNRIPIQRSVRHGRLLHSLRGISHAPLYGHSISQSFSIWRKAEEFFYDRGFNRARKFIGEDLDGNKYYIRRDTTNGRVKRCVEYVEEIPDINKLPTEGWAWLAHRRDTCPTKEELLLSEAKRAAFQEKVRLVEEKNAKEDHMYKPIASEGRTDYDQTLRAFDVKKMYQENTEARETKNNNNKKEN